LIGAIVVMAIGVMTCTGLQPKNRRKEKNFLAEATVRDDL
jgi:hypothetical protein